MNNLKKHYINPQDLIEYLYEADAINGRTAKLINQFPEEDVVKVVRCRDCIYNRGKSTDLWGNPVIVCMTSVSHKPDWYCASGKPKDGEQDDASNS